MGTLIDRFEEHDGPVRGVDFHRTQPLFVSGGDDYKIKVWSLTTRRCLFTLNGHLDYVRTVFFHHELPWIVSSSDDQTIRIWNWQNRQLICNMTGHNHYTMCAQFHPKEDLIVSASLDQSVRVWDISGLRKKHSAPTTMTFEDQMSRANGNQPDMFGNTDAVVKFVLEGHDRGVNWVSFHPTLPLIISAGDDRNVKLWRMSETKAWEVDTCRGHFQNASACLFHPNQDLILSVGEDKTIRVWDLNKRTSVQSFKRENDRFWVIAAHPEINLFAAGHDNGVMVFKLERERPAYACHQNQLFFINKEKHVKMFDFSNNNESLPMLSLKKLGAAWSPPRTLSYNPAERAILVTSPADGGVYELIHLPKDAVGAVEPTDTKRGPGNSAVFVARNRFAVFTSNNQTIEIKDLSNITTKSIKAPTTINEIYFGGVGCLLLCAPTSVILYDIQQKKTLAELPVAGVKYVVWSNDGMHAALLAKHNVTIVTKNLEQVSTLHETIRIKSATWDDAGVLLYSTLNHIKYTLLNGDNGIIRTLEETVYLTRVKGKSLYCLDRQSKPRTLTIDPTEYRFKLALVKRNYDEILHIIKTSNLVGQSIIAYLQKKGYPEIALEFVGDLQTRFELAIECGNLEVAVEMAKEINRPTVWNRLSTEALNQGNHQVVEMCYQRLKNLDKLSFLYLLTGDADKLTRMARIAESRNDPTAILTNSIYSGDVEARIQMFKEIDMYPLAYATAKAHGLTEECQNILETCGLTEDQIVMPQLSTPPKVAPVVFNTFEAPPPAREASQSFFQKALAGQIETLTLEDDSAAASNGFGDEVVEDKGDNLMDLDDDEDAGGWDMGDDDLGLEDAAEEAEEVGTADVAGTYPSEADVWVQGNPLAADHVSAGSFETAMQILNRQIGAVNFAPLKPRFMEIYQASRTYIPAAAGLPPLVNYVRRTLDQSNPRKVLPVTPCDLEALRTGKLQKGFQDVKSNNLESGIQVFRSILYNLMVTTVKDQKEHDEAQKMIRTATEYIIGLSIELERRRIQDDASQLKRNLELAAYFTQSQLEKPHRQIALVNAMKIFAKHRNFAHAAHFADRLLALTSTGKTADLAKQYKSKCERTPTNAVDVDYDEFTSFNVCPASLTPIYTGQPSVQDPFCGAHYLPEYKGQVCRVSQVTEIGAATAGLRLRMKYEHFF
ncbi:Similar to Coatomer subunit alpha; acc. no. P53622 [Pyronema omphalodes CBS 100304]|uniref:Coatomer subunit alpha n=1 Tax=Pyronema omphalodes (strain CBS 100304) TaxID=1076935 RepID=U4LH34_PYROM|nr:Similar to Coatomer subunit alpha; acc. no. P53622 [Pyronema omphalodes CBS 100304]